METVMLNQRSNSTLGSCREPFNTMHLVLNYMLPSFGFPTTMIVIGKLLSRLYQTKRFSSAEVFLLQINFTNLCLFIAHVVFSLDGQFSMTPIFVFFYGPSLTARTVFVRALRVIMYLAIVHPVTYMTVKTCRHWEWLVITLSWLYAFATSVAIIIYETDIFHPVFMVVFQVTILPCVFCNIAELRALSPSGSGNTRKTLNPVKRKAFWIVLSSLVALLMYYLPKTCVLIYAYVAPTDWKRFVCSEGLVIMMLPKFSEIAMPLIFLYSLCKIGV